MAGCGEPDQKVQRRDEAGLAPSAVATAPGTAFRDPMLGGGMGPEMVVIPAGRFEMGDLPGRGGPDEGPPHLVRFARPFALASRETSFDEFAAYAAATGTALPSDSGWGAGGRPVIHVSWEEARAYADWLGAQTGQNYRLPSEAEWEYAARAGSIELWHFGSREAELCDWGNVGDRTLKRELPDILYPTAECDDGYGASTAPVASYDANPFGLFDTIGNVAEWVEDCWHDSYTGAPADGRAWVAGGNCALRVLRGGSWDDSPLSLRAAEREKLPVKAQFDKELIFGFRLARDL